MKKKVLSLLSVFILMLPMVAAARDLSQLGSDTWKNILWVGGLGFLNLNPEVAIVAFARLLIALLVFTIIFAVIISLGAGSSGMAPFRFFNRSQAGVVAGILAIMVAVFTPGKILSTTGIGWATAVAFILIGGPIVGLGYLTLTYPGHDAHGRSLETRGTIFIKLLLCLLLIWILTVMQQHLSILGVS